MTDKNSKNTYNTKGQKRVWTTLQELPHPLKNK